MSSYLQRLGRFSFRRRRFVVGAWLTVLVAVGTTATLAGGSFSSNFSIPGTESQRALDLLAQRLPASSAAGAHSRLVFAAPTGSHLTANARRAIERTLTQVAAGATVASVTDPFTTGTVSRDNTVAYSAVTSKVTAGKLTQADRTAVARAERAAQAAGVRVYVSGDLGAQTQQGGTEAIGVAVALVVLIVTFGSVVAAGLPLLSAALGVGIGLMGIVLTSAFTDLSSAVETLAMMLGLAVGIDYALLILSRHRAQVHEGMDLEASAAHAVGTAGSAVVFAGSTVMIALVALITTGVPFMAAMGLAAAGTVAVAVLIALTLVPALLGFAGERAAKGKRLEALADRPGSAHARRSLGRVRYPPPDTGDRGDRAGGSRAGGSGAPPASRSTRRLDRRGRDAEASSLRPRDARLRPRRERSAHRGRRHPGPRQRRVDRCHGPRAAERAA